MLRDQKQELIDKAHEKEVARNVSLGLPIYVKSEKELEDERIEKEQKKKEAQKTMDDLNRKVEKRKRDADLLEEKEKAKAAGDLSK